MKADASYRELRERMLVQQPPTAFRGSSRHSEGQPLSRGAWRSLCALALWGVTVAHGCQGDLAFERGLGDFCDGPSACADGLYCDLSSQRCNPLQARGTPCTIPNQCDGGFCVFGICCDGPCNRSCLSCSVEGLLGECSNVPEGEDLHGHCPGTTSCSALGFCQGAPLWTRGFGDQADDEAAAIALGADGTVYVAGSFLGHWPIDADSQQLAVGGRDVFVLALEPGGALRWSLAFGSVADDIATDLVVDEDGRVIVVGDFGATMTVLGNALSPQAGDAFAIALAPDGSSAAWARSLSGPGNQHITSVAMRDDGIVIGGYFDGTIAYDGGDTVPSLGGQDAFVARLGPGGDVLWHRELGDDADQRASALDVGADEVVVAITGRGAVDTGADQIAGSSDDDDLFVARLDATTGAGGSVLLFGGQGDQRATGLRIDDQQDLWLAGSYTRELLIPGGPTLVGAEDVDGFYSKLSPTGVHLQSEALGGPFDDAPIGLTIDDDGNVIVVGRFELELALGDSNATLDAAGGADLFIIKLSPNASELWSQPFGGPLADRAVAVVADGSGDLIAAGDFEAELTLADLSISAVGGRDVFVAKFAR
jgi:hypothetical protein